MSAVRTILGLSVIADAYDAFLVDQFGVLRDGRGPYPGAAETLVRLKTAGKRIIILSNSGKRSAENDRRLAELGFEPGSWDWFLTSGEVAWQLLNQEAAATAGGTRKCLLVSRDGDLSPLNGLDLVRTDSGEAADIVLIAASEGDVYPLAHYEDLLRPAARRGVPCLCTNPDKVMLTPSGQAFGAGRIAELYEGLGGKVRWIGKPFPDIYDLALDFLGRPDPARVCAIGDSIEHDIAGATGAGLGSVLVTTGILEHQSEEERRRLFDEHGVTPDFILPRFLW
ncbi:HAD superfamily protein involved in N-acetyl-glucosamine catabolism (plasmid) [Sinorhizobium fredii NGR234]|uniref:HAD superfamily protein involved in N-acetyl-glucosamine catabolism n=1 Tax=Sinorhizobium fredii (strain NBRC 101917 / NGR234) TaxID=394 RepID=Q6W291_SINFN|nr:TIGR01459 family HAD-type hydrolase [Sinorhizobium fredii]AAQ87126.1 HAD superfamily protein involved in N-acetyl-glucosamine catabolism [Sinorhizobium fredii NGR234]ACP23193.1 HAD superfamily protein involved in N-acetyl-glucosamine catabolism [Sinorhizobium fredii NGR234]